jgi:hypothetical protein
MNQTKRECKACLKNKDVKQFYWHKKQRTVLRVICHKCFAAWLLSDTSGKRITNAASRGEINRIYADALRTTLANTRAATNEQRKAKLRDIATKQHERRRDLFAQYGIRAATPTERLNPESLAAFERDQKPRLAKYRADTAREQARRDKISATLTGRKRADRVPSAAERLSAAARERSSSPASAGGAVVDEHPDWPNED